APVDRRIVRGVELSGCPKSKESVVPSRDEVLDVGSLPDVNLVYVDLLELLHYMAAYIAAFENEPFILLLDPRIPLLDVGRHQIWVNHTFDQVVGRNVKQILCGCREPKRWRRN